MRGDDKSVTVWTVFAVNVSHLLLELAETKTARSSGRAQTTTKAPQLLPGDFGIFPIYPSCSDSVCLNNVPHKGIPVCVCV